jgi:hypothetical protein
MIWTRISPPFKPGAAAQEQFSWFLVLSTMGLLVITALKAGAGTAFAFVLVYLLVIPGVLGFGWFVIYIVWMGINLRREHVRTIARIESDFRTAAAAYGPVRYLDVSVDGDQFTGLAVAGDKLLVVQDGQMRQLPRQELRSWRWAIDHPAHLIGSFDLVDRLKFRGEEQKALNVVKGVFLVTYDPDRPELQFRTSSEAVCRRWETILQNIWDNRLHIA